MPALLAMNVVVVAVLVVVSLIFGRVYCSVLCPLGLCRMSYRGFTERWPSAASSYSPAVTWLRITMLALFVLLIALGLARIAAFIEPYSEYGRIVSSLVKPLYVDANNALAAAESPDSYTFWHVDYYVTWAMVAVAAITFIVVAVLAWMNGRTYCNTVCPVGTILGYLSQFSWLKPVIDTSKCNHCRIVRPSLQGVVHRFKESEDRLYALAWPAWTA